MARKSRKQPISTAPAPALSILVALYIRLSVEDNKKRGCSIENQKLVLNDFLEDKPEFVVYDTYIDNGATGTNFHRVGFQQMLSNIEAGHINCVIVKDLSRLGRNSIDTGYYIEQYCGCCDHAMSLRNDSLFYCRHAQVARDLPCYGVKVRMSELEQAVFEIIRGQVTPALGIDTSKDKLDLQTVQQSEHEEKLRAIQAEKRQLYEQYALGEIDLETYRVQKEKLDAALIKAKNVHAVITAQTKQIQCDYEARLKQREITQELGNANALTQALIDRLIKRIYLFPGDRIEIEYVTQDFLGIEAPEKEA